MIVLRDVEDALISGCLAPAGISVFLRLQDGCFSVSAIDNDLNRVVVPFQKAESVLLYTEANRLKNQ
jgi:hypothetical protein